MARRLIPDAHQNFGATSCYKHDGKLHIDYEDEWVEYELIEDELVWSDGPPHPKSLQLARRTSRTSGVVDPR